MRDGQSRKTTIVRGQHANLVRLESPGGKTIEFQYDRGHRIVRATASTGESVSYDYDDRGRLVKVEGGPQRVVRYAYHGTMIRAAYGETDQPLFSLDYTNTLPSRLVLRGTTTYTLWFTLDHDRKPPVSEASIKAADGTWTTIKIAESAATP